MSDRNFFGLKYTPEEWETLERQAARILRHKFDGASHRTTIPHLKALINTSIYKIGKSACENCDPEEKAVKQKLYFPVNDPEIFNALSCLATSKGIDLSTLMQRLVVTPLFTDIYTGNAF